MSKKVRLILTAALFILTVPARPQNSKFSKYKAIESYEIRPGILIMPRYGEGKEVCEIALEKLHYERRGSGSEPVIHLASSLDRKVIDQIADELAPVSDRGQRIMGKSDLIVGSGQNLVTLSEYENVSIEIYGDGSHTCNEGDIVAVIKWKGRKCQ